MLLGTRWSRPGRARTTAVLLGAALLTVATTALVTGSGPAGAQTVAPVGPGPIGTLPVIVAAPVADPASVQARPCLAGTADTAAAISSAPWAQRQLNFEAAWAFGRGAGQKVAVIDTGVNPLPRLRVVGGGDYVAAGNGTVDCDGHGTIVASLIGARRDLVVDPTGYSGVAPDATIFSVRQYSGLYETTKVGKAPSTPGDLSTLASAIVWAADQGATVINISESACGVAAKGLGGDAAVGAALRFAVDERDVVVVAAAGNVGSAADPACATNNATDGVTPPVTAVSPAWWDDYVLAVGSVGENGRPSPFTLAGPWVDVAAPGEGIVSLNPVSGPPLINLLTSAGGSSEPIQGTSFATPYVAGTVALVRERFPELTARQVMARVEATAHAPAGGVDNLVGHGIIDPVAAVTDVLPADVQPRGIDTSSSEFVVPTATAAPSTTPRTVALAGSAIAVGVVLATLVVLNAVQRARRRPC